jgi:hypothetical protein
VNFLKSELRKIIQIENTRLTLLQACTTSDSGYCASPRTFWRVRSVRQKWMATKMSHQMTRRE